MKKVFITLASVAFASASFAQTYSFDDMTGANYDYYFTPQGASNSAVAENTVLANLDTINDVELIVYNPTSVAISGSTVTLTLLDSSATNPDPGGPGNILFTQTYTLGTLAATTYYDYSLPTGNLNLTNTNIWTAFGFSNASVATLINANAPSIGSAPAVLFAVDTTSLGWQDNYELGGGTIPPYFGIRFDVTAAPEPVSMAFLGLGVVGLIARRRNRK